MYSRNERLEEIIEKAKDKWASYGDILEGPKALIDALIDEARHYCFDAVNLQFELSSSTSGMYPKWYIKISMSCTVYIGKPQPVGIGNSFSAACADFILKGRKLREEKDENI